MSLLFRELLIQWNGKELSKGLLVTDQKLPQHDLFFCVGIQNLGK
jgi:hypothetical protein